MQSKTKGDFWHIEGAWPHWPLRSTCYQTCSLNFVMLLFKEAVLLTCFYVLIYSLPAPTFMNCYEKLESAQEISLTLTKHSCEIVIYNLSCTYT